MLTARPVARGGDEQVGLAAQERRDLQHVGDLGGRGGLRRLVDVGQDRHADSRALTRAEDPQALVAGPGRGTSDRRPVRLVVRRLEDERACRRRAAMSRIAAASSIACAPLSMTQGPAIEDERAAAADGEGANLDGVHGDIIQSAEDASRPPGRADRRVPESAPPSRVEA